MVRFKSVRYTQVYLDYLVINQSLGYLNKIKETALSRSWYIRKNYIVT